MKGIRTNPDPRYRIGKPIRWTLRILLGVLVFGAGLGKLLDIPGDSIRVDGLPEPPENLRISHIDVVVRLVAK